MFTGLCTWVCVLAKIKKQTLISIYRFFEKFWRGGQSPPAPPPPLNGRSSHLIEAAKRGRLDQMIFFSAPLTTRAPPTTVRRPPAGACDMKKKRKVGFTKSRFSGTVSQGPACHHHSECYELHLPQHPYLGAARLVQDGRVHQLTQTAEQEQLQ